MSCLQRTMTRLRPPNPDSLAQPSPRPLRIIASGTLFLTHTLSLPSHPAPDSVCRAQAVSRARGGGASVLLKTLAQLAHAQGMPALVDAQLVAPLAGNDEGRLLMRELEHEGVGLRYCKVWEGANVPCAWVLRSTDTNSTSVINHNPLPDITHEEFVSLLGPLLAPENYGISYFPAYPSPSASPIATHPSPPSPRPPSRPGTGTRLGNPFQAASPAGTPGLSPVAGPSLAGAPSPAPFDWLHFEGRSIKTTLNNMIGIDGLAKERKWRRHCVFSLDLGRKPRSGVELLIPHADVIFTTYQYALSQSPSPNMSASPRAFLLSLLTHAPKHALLVAYWGRDGGAVLSVPTREYFQSSGWVAPRSAPIINGRHGGGARTQGHESVRSGSDFYAVQRTPSGSMYTAAGASHTHSHSRDTDTEEETGTELGEGAGEDVAATVDEAGAQDAFVAGMVYALSRRLMPGGPWTPAVPAGVAVGGAAGVGAGATNVGTSAGGEAKNVKETWVDEGDRWRLDECLRFATELAGRKARRKGWDGVVSEVAAGWFEGAGQ